MPGKQKPAKVERNAKIAHDQKNAEIAKQKNAKVAENARNAKNAKHGEFAEIVKNAKMQCRQRMQNLRKSKDCQ